MSRTRVAAVLTLGILGALQSRVRAEPRASQCSAGAVYATEMREAVAAHDAARYVQARAHFECAHQLEASARTWLGLALASYALHDFERAYEEFDKALADRRNQLSDAEREGMQPTIEEISKELATLRVNVYPPDAQLFVDSVAKDGRTLHLRPGSRELRAEARGYETRETAVELRADTDQSIELSLSNRSGPNHTLAFVSGGIGVAAVGVGAVFGILSINKHSESDRGCRMGKCNEAGAKAMDDAIVFGNVSTVAWIVGGVGLAGAAVLWFTAGSSEDDPKTPAIGFAPGSVQLRAAF